MIQLLATLFLILAGASAQAGDRVVYVINWSDYIDPGVLEDFTRETGVKVVHDTYGSNETLEARLAAGGSGYDIVVRSASLLETEIRAGLLQPIDRTRLANAENIATEIDARLSRYATGSRHAIPYMWRTTGVAYNVTKVTHRIGKPISSWDQVLRLESLKKLADCGVYMLDSPEDMLPTVLHFLKLDPNSKSLDDLRKAADLLGGLSKYVKKFQSADHIEALASGEACLAVGRTGDSLQARTRAREMGVDVEIAYAVPTEGALLSIDALAIPKSAQHVSEAYLFIDYLLRPDVAARNSRVTNSANGVVGERMRLDTSIVDDSALYPGEPAMRRLFTVTAANADQSRAIARLWTMVKAGR